MTHPVLHYLLRVLAVPQRSVKKEQRVAYVVNENLFRKVYEELLGHRTQKIEDKVTVYLPVAARKALVENAEAVSHRAVRIAAAGAGGHLEKPVAALRVRQLGAVFLPVERDDASAAACARCHGMIHLSFRIGGSLLQPPRVPSPNACAGVVLYVFLCPDDH